MKLRKSLLLTIFTVTCFISFDQRENLPVVNFTTRDYGKNFNPEIYCSIQDKRGVMYFGLGNGIQEFDGSKWHYIKVLAGAYVRSLAVDSSGTVYVGTYGDFGFLEPDSLGEMKYTSLLDKVPLEDQFFSDIWSVYSSSDKVYFHAQEVFFVYDVEDETLSVQYPDDFSSFHTAFMVDGTFYVRAREVGIQKYEDGKLVALKGTEMVSGLGVFGMYRGADDSLLIITQEIGLWKWKDGAARQLPEVNEVPLSELGIYGGIHLSDGNFAVWTFTSGVFVIDQKGNIVQHFDRQSGLHSNDVKHVYEDRDNNLWLSMENGVAMVNYYAPFSYYGEKAGINGNVVAIQRFKENLYVGTSNGLYVQDNTGNSLFNNVSSLKTSIYDFCVVDDHLYIATAKGVMSTNNGVNYTTRTPVGTDANAISYIDDLNLFVVSGPHGISVYSRSFQKIYHHDERLSLTLGIEKDPEKENVVWVGTVSNGAYKLVIGDSIQIDRYDDFDGLLDNIGKPLFYHDSLVFGSKEGLSYFLDEEEMKKGLTEEELKDPDNYRGMFQVQDLHGYTTYGQFLYLECGEEKDWYSEDNYSIAYYDHENQEFIQRPFKGVDVGRINVFYLEDDGTLWVGGVDGLIGYTGREKKSYETQFYTLIRKLSVGEDSLVFNGSFYQDGKIQAHQSEEFILNLDYKHNSVKFQFSTAFYEYRDAITYSYFLEGYDKNWSKWSKLTEAKFTNLNEGDYTFKVKSRNVYGVESEITEFKFSISPPWYRTTWAYLLYGIGFIVVFFVGFRIFSLRLKRKNQWLEGVVEERTREIREKNTVLAHQKQEIEDSINYAQRIQEAILPLEQEMKKWMPKSFVLFRPKDIVSGDFYWFLEKDGKLIFICADCTGHGVPGAFMSMIGADRLSIIVGERKILSPSKILSELNKAIKKSLKQDGEAGSTRDGMDAAVCTIDLKKNELKYAGANRPLWIVESDEVNEIKATKVAVAGFTPDEQVFEEHTIKLKPGLKFYMTSDGYADQFGGERGKKLKVKAMKEFILNVCNKDFGTQKDELDKNLIEWMAGYEQIDDVCVVGFEPVQ